MEGRSWEGRSEDSIENGASEEASEEVVDGEAKI